MVGPLSRMFAKRDEKAAKLGDPEAMFNLGGYAFKAGDRGVARAWWEKAAKLGNLNALFNLGSLAKEAGDRDAARVWWEQAAKLGDEHAARLLAELDASSN